MGNISNDITKGEDVDIGFGNIGPDSFDWKRDPPFTKQQSLELFTVQFEELEDLKTLKMDPYSREVDTPKYFSAKYEGKKVMVELYSNDVLLTEENPRTLFHELTLWKNSDCSNILKLLGVFLHPAEKSVGIVVENSELGCVRDFVERKKKELKEEKMVLTISQKFRILRGVINALSVLEENNTSLRASLSWKRVFLTKNLEAKLFGLHTPKRKEHIYMARKEGTSAHVAPEATLCFNYGIEAEIFSLGIMIWELMCEDFDPFGKRPEFNIELKVALNPECRPDLNRVFGGDDDARIEFGWLLDLMAKCWARWDVVQERCSLDHVKKEFNEHITLQFQTVQEIEDLQERCEFVRNQQEQIFGVQERRDFVKLKIGSEFEIEKLFKTLFL